LSKDKIRKRAEALLSVFDNSPNDGEYTIDACREFWISVETILKKDKSLEARIGKTIKKLWYSKFWVGRSSTYGKTSFLGLDIEGNELYKMRVNRTVRLFFNYVKGAVRPTIALRQICTDHDKQEKLILQLLLKPPLIEKVLEQIPEPQDVPMGNLGGENYRTIPNKKRLGDMQEWMKSHANIRPTIDQLKSILQPVPPILIDGQAGTGKTSMLALRAALGVSKKAGATDRKVLCTCYSRSVLKLIEKDIKDHLVFHFNMEEGTPEGIEFETFPKIIYNLLPPIIKQKYDNPDHRPLRRRVAFSHFARKFYPEIPHKAHQNQIGISPELVWHAIRSILKGLRMDGEVFDENDIVQLNDGSKKARLPRKETQEFDAAQWKFIFEVYVKYEKWKESNNFYDDMDLAFDAWKTVKDYDPSIYNEIYLDEAQDLTRIEFELLKKLQSGNPPWIILAGDPLQTINPTGFDWGRIRAFVYDEKRNTSVDIVTLDRNFRTPESIVHFSNDIQKLRGYYSGKKPSLQKAHVIEGEQPICLKLKSDKDHKGLQGILRDPPPETAIIVWARDDEEVYELLENDPDYHEIWKFEDSETQFDEKLMLHTVSMIKGLEFTQIILYKFGSHVEFKKWSKHTINELEKDRNAGKIPLLYHLNRLFISITRSKLRLYIIDEEDAFDEVWESERWTELLDHNRSNFASQEFKTPAFAHSDGDYIEDSKKYLNHFLDDYDLRMLRFAEQSCMKAPLGEIQKKLLWEIRAYKHEDLSQTSKDENDRRKHKVESANYFKLYGNYSKSASLYFDANEWNKTIETLDEMEALDEKLTLLKVVSRIKISSDQESKTVLRSYTASISREKYREEYKSSGSIDTMFGTRLDIVIKELNRLKLWEQLRTVLGDVLFVSNSLDAPRMLCRYLNRAEQFTLTRKFIEDKKLKKKLSGSYVKCLEQDIKKTAFPDKKRIQIHQSIVSSTKDKKKETEHKRGMGLNFIGLLLQKEVKKAGKRPKKIESGKEFIPNPEILDKWSRASKYIDIEDQDELEEESDEFRDSLNLKTIYIAKGWSSYKDNRLSNAMIDFSNACNPSSLHYWDKMSKSSLAFLNEKIEKLYSDENLWEVVWHLSFQAEEFEMDQVYSRRKAVKAIIGAGSISSIRNKSLEERMSRLALRKSKGNGVLTAREWLIKTFDNRKTEYYPKLASIPKRDKLLAKTVASIYINNQEWEEASNFAEENGKLLPSQQSTLIRARHIENIGMGSKPVDFPRDELRKLSTLYRNANKPNDSKRILALIPKDPASDIKAILSSRSSWDSRLLDIREIMGEKHDDETIQKMWKIVSKSISRNSFKVIGHVNSGNKLGVKIWNKVMKVHDNDLRKLIGAYTIGNGALVLEFACPERWQVTSWLSKVNRLNQPKVCIPLLYAHCTELRNTVEKMADSDERLDDMYDITASLFRKLRNENRGVNKIKKSKDKKPDDISLQIAQIRKGIYLRTLRNPELEDLIDGLDIENKSKFKLKPDMMEVLLKHEFGEPGKGAVLKAFRTALKK